MQYLITGGVGFIGSHLVKAALDDSIKVTVIDRRSPNESPILNHTSNIKEAEFIKADLLDPNKASEVNEVISKVKPDVVYHLAAQPLSILSNKYPLETAKDNILATYSFLEALRDNSPKSRLVYSSSACFYGVPKDPPLREDDPPAVGHYIYTATKIAADFAVQHYRHIYHLNCVNARMVNVYGPGEIHYERIVPRLINLALQGEAPTLTQSDGSDVLSFLYVGDAVRALQLLGSHPNAIEKPVWNISGSAPISILELMKRIYNLIGLPTEHFAVLGLRCGSPVHKYLDGSMIKEKLGFSPLIDLDIGLGHTIDWYRDQCERVKLA
jgi:CDP-glucose 4,6-dehydratase